MRRQPQQPGARPARGYKSPKTAQPYRRRFAREPESDQKIGTKPDAFPAHEHQEVVIRENQRQHEKDKEIQISEVSIEPFLMRHVAGGINMDQKSDTGHDENHQAREM